MTRYPEGDVSKRRSAFLLIVVQHDTFQKERRQFGTPAEPALLIDRDGVLADRSLAPIGTAGDLLVPVTLQQQ